MSYPLTSPVSAGDATLASHYNNLRKDTLYLGQDSADAVDLGTVLERFQARLQLERLSTDRVRVPATASAPVSLIVDGYPVQAVADVDLAAGDAPSGAANTYYVFAERADDATTFTLSVSTSPTETADLRKIGRFYWDGSKIVKDSVRTELAGHVADLLYLVDPQICNLRLTLSTGVPVPVSDVSSSANVYLTPHKGNRIALYVPDYGWRIYATGELTLDVSGYSSGVNVDVFIYDNAGTLTLSGVEWSNDTLRATAITRQDGVLVKSGSPEYRYLGTVRTSGAGVVCDTVLKRFVWNYYNRILRDLLVTEDTDSWTYAVADTWRPLNNDTSNRVEFVIGVDETLVSLECCIRGWNASNKAFGIGIGLDKTDDTDSVISSGNVALGTTYNRHNYGSLYRGLPGIGYHYLQLVEVTGADTTTFLGDRGCSNNQQLTGGAGYILM